MSATFTAATSCATTATTTRATRSQRNGGTRTCRAHACRARDARAGGEDVVNEADSALSSKMTRRALATTFGALAAAVTMCPAPARAANPFEALGAARRATNARFLMGPVALSRARLTNLRRDVVDYADVDALEKKIAEATLDCLQPRGILDSYSKVKDVCTLSILARSATDGPASFNDPSSAESIDVYAALDAARASYTALEDVLLPTLTDDASARDNAKIDAAFDASDDALKAFASALLACFRFDDADARAIVDAVPGAFVAR